MRDELKNHMQRVQRQLSNLENKIHYIKRHVHDKNGRAIVEQPLTEYYGHEESSLLSEAKMDNSGIGSYF